MLLNLWQKFLDNLSIKHTIEPYVPAARYLPLAEKVTLKTGYKC